MPRNVSFFQNADMLWGPSIFLLGGLFDLNNFDLFIVVVLPIEYFHYICPYFLEISLHICK
jgi:hypothetical protein